MTRSLLITCLLVFAATGSWAEVQVRATLDQRAELGYLAPAELTIEVLHGPDQQVTFPMRPRLPAMVMVTETTPETETDFDGAPEDGSIVRTTKRYTLDAFGPIRLVVASMEVDVDGMAYPLPAFVLDRPALSEEKEKELSAALDIVPPRELLARTAPPWWQIGAAVAVAIALATLILWWLKRRKQAAEGPPVPPWDTARQRLRELRHRKLPEAGKYERYYVDLSAILRYYIEDRFHLRAPEQTTPEFLAAASASGELTSDQQLALSAFLRQSDRVKFARYRPSVDEMVEDFDVVDRFVSETIPKVEEEKQEEATA
jgi:hypothetical protein